MKSPAIQRFVTALGADLLRWGADHALVCEVASTAAGIDLTLRPLAGDDEPLLLRLTPREWAAPSFRQTARFDLAYRAADDSLSAEQQAQLEAVLGLVGEREAVLPRGAVASSLAALKAGTGAPGVGAYGPAPTERRGTVKLTRHCNLDCAFCQERPKALRHHVRRLAPIDRMLRKLRAQGYEAVNFDGGEPTLSPLLPDAIRRARALGFQGVKVVTNGTLLAKRQLLDGLREAGCSGFIVSLHAVDPAAARAVYGCEPTQRQLAGIAFVRREAPELELSFNVVVQQANLADLGRILETMQGFEPQQISVIYSLLRLYLPDQLRQVRLASLEDGRLLAAVDGHLRRHPDSQLALRHYPKCRLPQEHWPRLQTRGRGSANTIGRALQVPPAPNRQLCPDCPWLADCHFPLLAYLLQRVGPRALLADGLRGRLGQGGWSSRFRAGELDPG